MPSNRSIQALTAVGVLCASALCATAGAAPTQRHHAKKPAASAKRTSAKPATVPFGEAASPGMKPPRAIPSKNSPGFMDDGASKEKK